MANPVTNLWLDDVRPCPYVGNWTVAKNFDEAVAIMTNYSVDRCSLDHDLAPDHYLPTDPSEPSTEKTGYDFVQWMEANDCWPTHPPIVHSWNPIGARRMAQTIARHYGLELDTVLIRPYRRPA
jgi:hypothetical protein